MCFLLPRYDFVVKVTENGHQEVIKNSLVRK